MATFDAPDMLIRLRTLFGGKRWAGNYYDAQTGQENAWNNGTDGNPAGRLYALFYPIATALSFLMLYTWPFVRLQTRLATAQDEYADLAWQDFFRNRYGRIAGESNAATTTRLRQKIIAKTGVQNAVLTAVQGFFTQFPDDSVSQDVFDRQTDPARSAYYGIKDAQFAVILYYPEYIGDPGFFLGQSFLGQDFLTDPFSFAVSESAPYPGLAQAVNDAKDLGYRPIYIASHGENPSGTGWGSNWGDMLWESP